MCMPTQIQLKTVKMVEMEPESDVHGGVDEAILAGLARREALARELALPPGLGLKRRVHRLERQVEEQAAAAVAQRAVVGVLADDRQRSLADQVGAVPVSQRNVSQRNQFRNYT